MLLIIALDGEDRLEFADSPEDLAQDNLASELTGTGESEVFVKAVNTETPFIAIVRVVNLDLTGDTADVDVRVRLGHGPARSRC